MPYHEFFSSFFHGLITIFIVFIVVSETKKGVITSLVSDSRSLYFLYSLESSVLSLFDFSDYRISCIT